MQAIVKQLCKPFEPAADRFEGIATETDEASGCVVLKDAASYVTCSVKDRMEAVSWPSTGLHQGSRGLVPGLAV